MKLSAGAVRSDINKLAAKARKKMRVLRKKKNVKALNQLGSVLYIIRDTFDSAVSVFEELSSDAEHAAEDVEDEQQDKE